MAKKRDTSTYVDTRAKPTFTKGTIYIGMNETLEVLPVSQAARRARSESLWWLYLPFTIAFALALGALAYGAVRLARFRLLPDPTLLPEGFSSPWLQNGGAAAVLALLLGMMLGFRTPFRMICLLAGVGIAMLGFHNLVHMYPDLFAQAFSPAWVSNLRLTAPNESWLYMGKFTPF